ncbi:YceD family protein [Sneathiella sp.]|uniref:YceD family protein n=1 Tax=Sneathiella sp. TaxID=1964365 RepID=UPI0039E6FEFC
MQDTGEEFARWVNVERLGREPVRINITASEDECRILAERLEILQVASAQMKASVGRKEGSGLIELTGSIVAEVDQACVVSLEPVRQKIEEDFVMCYTFNREDALVEDVDYVVSMEEADLPELIIDGQIDVVQALIEQIALSLEPYPRADDSEISKASEIIRDLEEEVVEEQKETHRPFADLKKMMNKD